MNTRNRFGFRKKPKKKTPGDCRAEGIKLIAETRRKCVRSIENCRRVNIIEKKQITAEEWKKKNDGFESRGEG